MKPEFHEEQQALMKPLISEACACVPRGWREALLEITAKHNSLSRTRAMNHRLTNPDGSEVQGLPQSLFECTPALHELFCQHGQDWKKSELKLSFDQAGRLIRSETSFHYA